MLDIKSRDVLNEDASELDMRKCRLTDMKNNRDVKIQGPGRPQVEADNNARIGVWNRQQMCLLQVSHMVEETKKATKKNQTPREPPAKNIPPIEEEQNQISRP